MEIKRSDAGLLLKNNKHIKMGDCVCFFPIIDLGIVVSRMSRRYLTENRKRHPTSIIEHNIRFTNAIIFHLCPLTFVIMRTFRSAWLISTIRVFRMKLRVVIRIAPTVGVTFIVTARTRTNISFKKFVIMVFITC